MIKSKILILDGDHKNCLAIVRQLGQTNLYEIHIVSYKKLAITFLSKYTQKKITISSPKKNRDAFINELLHVLANDNYLVLIPVSYISFQICSSIKQSILKFTKISIASEESIKIASSKIATYKYAQQLAIPYPNFIEINNIDEIKDVEFTYPCVIKAPYELGKNVVDYAHNKTELVDKYLKICKANNFKDKLPIIQRFIEGEGVGYFAFYQKGQLKSFFIHKRLREYPVTGGASTSAEGYYNKYIAEYGKKILDSLQWEGVAMVEFKKDNSTGTYNLMEINAKFWGSLDLALVSGVNFPQMMIDDALNKDLPITDSYKQIRFQWILNGDLFHILERPSHLFMFIKDLFIAKNDIYLKDIIPNLFQILLIPIHYYKKWFK